MGKYGTERRKCWLEPSSRVLARRCLPSTRGRHDGLQIDLTVVSRALGRHNGWMLDWIVAERGGVMLDWIVDERGGVDVGLDRG